VRFCDQWAWPVGDISVTLTEHVSVKREGLQGSFDNLLCSKLHFEYEKARYVRVVLSRTKSAPIPLMHLLIFLKCAHQSYGM
jgi:hypothetical protein